ncbi:C39 family peptidase [Ruminococcus flavefaciens]|uniref:C39 family peptidase n=1 Tax=Ruminococcus flavefaciens TaxID=1265 RepID=UPI0002FF9C09|nr:C39 family peptidase [Ruminococcus flavefaciens]
MKRDTLRKAVAAAAACIALTSCGDTVTLMSSETEAASDSNTGGAAVSEPVTEHFTLDISYPKGEKLPKKYVIQGFKTVMQTPELPTGCEITALCQTLNFLGFDIDKVKLADEFLPMDNTGVTTMKNAYIGDPKSDEGFGCYSPVIVQTADDYFQSIDSPCYAVDLSGSPLEELYYQLNNDRPVIVWTTIDLICTPPMLRWVTMDDEEMWFNDFQHCVTLCGYDLDENIVYVADPLKGNRKYDISAFSSSYELMGRQAVVICGNADTGGNYVEIKDKPQSAFLSRNKAERKKAEEEEARRKAEEAERKKTEEESKKKVAEDEKRRAEEEKRRAEEDKQREEQNEPSPVEEVPESPDDAHEDVPREEPETHEEKNEDYSYDNAADKEGQE